MLAMTTVQWRGPVTLSLHCISCLSICCSLRMPSSSMQPQSSRSLSPPRSAGSGCLSLPAGARCSRSRSGGRARVVWLLRVPFVSHSIPPHLPLPSPSFSLLVVFSVPVHSLGLHAFDQRGRVRAGVPRSPLVPVISLCFFVPFVVCRPRSLSVALVGLAFVLVLSPAPLRFLSFVPPLVSRSPAFVDGPVWDVAFRCR